MIGLAQIPLVLLIDDTLGSSTAYCTVMSQLIPTSLSKTSLLRYFDNVINNMESWWQVCSGNDISYMCHVSMNVTSCSCAIETITDQSLTCPHTIKHVQRLYTYKTHELTTENINCKILCFCAVPPITTGYFYDKLHVGILCIIQLVWELRQC